jgi:hemoglobin-like flavoprotein
MTPAQAELVRRSFDLLWPARRGLAEDFYARFFALAPDARRLFPENLERQQMKLMDMIASIVGALDEREIFQSVIHQTGVQHAQIGVLPTHFAAFGDALVGGLEQQLGPAFTPELKEAWVVLYRTVQDQMISVASSRA